MRDEFLIERHGKKYVLYAGLVDAAHDAGLKSIETELLQIPSSGNGDVAICKAVVTLEDGRSFAGIGDASSSNVGRAIAPHIIRQAETRAKARALRDALSVGAAALEELSGDDDPGQARGGAHAADTAVWGRNRGRTASEKSAGYLKGLLDNAEEYDREELERQHGPVETWSQAWVSKLIDRLVNVHGSESGSA